MYHNNTPTKESKTKIHKTINSDEKKPFFLMTLEDNMGKCKQIKIFQNTNPSELAYNFCKENNLDFSSMKYIKSNIKTIVKQFNESKQKSIYSNNIIKEEENEDDYLSENTLKNNEKKKLKKMMKKIIQKTSQSQKKTPTVVLAPLPLREEKMTP